MKKNYSEMPNGYLETIQNGISAVRTFRSGLSYGSGTRQENLIRLKKEQNIPDDGFYHYDTPLTVDHEKEALLSAGFSSVTILKNWGATYTLKADK